MSKRPKPTWWLLNSLFVGTGLALFLAHELALPPFLHQLLLLVLVVLGYGLIAIWLWNNATELETERQQRKQASHGSVERLEQRRTRSREVAALPLNARQQHFRQVTSLHISTKAGAQDTPAEASARSL